MNADRSTSCMPASGACLGFFIEARPKGQRSRTRVGLTTPPPSHQVLGLRNEGGVLRETTTPPPFPPATGSGGELYAPQQGSWQSLERRKLLHYFQEGQEQGVVLRERGQQPLPSRYLVWLRVVCSPAGFRAEPRLPKASPLFSRRSRWGS